MDIEAWRSEMVAYRQNAEYEAKALKDTYLVVDRFRSLYEKLDELERRMADRVLSEWVMSEDEGVRFDAVLLIGEFTIQSALPALHALALRLPLSTAPGAPYELKKVVRLIQKLAAERPPGRL
jgi:hypothetical protein